MPPLLLRWRIKFCQAAKLILGVSAMVLTVGHVHAVSPTLIDLAVNDTPPLQLTTGVDYLIVLTNDNPHGTSFYFGEFAQGVLTHYMQGAASVTQESVDIPANAKVQWLFSPIKAGEYNYYAINGSSDQKGDKGKITVKLAEGANALPVEKTEVSVVEDPKATKQAKKTESDNKETLVINETRRWLKGGRRD